MPILMGGHQPSNDQATIDREHGSGNHVVAQGVKDGIGDLLRLSQAAQRSFTAQGFENAFGNRGAG